MSRPQDSQSDYRKCPSCAEWVKAEAKLCRFCRSRLTPHSSDKASAEESQPTFSHRSSGSGFKISGKQIGIGAAILALFALCFAVVPNMMKSGKTMTGKWVANPLVNIGGREDSLPALSGEWEVDYEYKGNPFIANATFAQSGNVLTGHGADKDGSQWVVDKGQIQGTRVSFGKKYADSPDPPTTYTGDLKFLRSPEYTGWAMEGTYTATEQAAQ